MWLALLNVFFPLRCAICHTWLSPDDKYYLCIHCWRKIVLVTPPHCPLCSKPGCRVFCFECRSKEIYFDRAWAAGIYKGILRDCIHQLKYARKTWLAQPLALLMYQKWQLERPEDDYHWLIPVPLHWRKKQAREFNQAELIAKRLSSLTGIPTNKKVLIRRSNIAAQSRLGRRERMKNISGVFRVFDRSAVKDKTVMLIDDVFTTGATVNECARVLRESGARKVSVFAVARGE